MNEISCRAFSYFQVAERRGLLDVDRLLAGLPIDRRTLEDPHQRVDWDLWAELCDRAAAQLGHDPDRLGASGEVIVEGDDNTIAGMLGPIAALFVSLDDLYDVTARWGGPALYRSHTFARERLPDGRIRFTAALRPGYRPCLAWFQMIPGALRALPRLAGLPAIAVVTEAVTPTTGSYLIAAGPALTLRARLRQAWAAVRSPRAVSDELAFQQGQLSLTLDALRRSERGFQAALDALPAYVALHHDGYVVYANPALANAIGEGAQTLLGRPVAELIHPDDRARFQRAALSATGTEPLTVRLRRANGTPRLVSAAPVPSFEFGGRRTEGLFASDVTEQVRTQETVAILHAALPDLLVRLDRDGQLLDVRGGKELAVHAELLAARIGTRPTDLLERLPGLRPEHVARFRATLADALASGQEQLVELQAELGDARTFELRVVPRQQGDEVLILIRDVTTLRREAQRRANTDRLASVGTLAAGVAHEINNPLTYIMSGHDELDAEFEQLERGAAVDVPALRRTLAEVREGTERVRDIVASMRTFSRLDPVNAVRPVDPRDAVRRAASMCAAALRHQARLETELGDTPLVMADLSKLIQVVVNLLVNAGHAVAAVADRERVVRVVTSTDAAHRARIEVQDTGVGMTPATMERIFDPFFTTKDVGHGTGLGLSVSQQLVHEFRGELTVSSVLGQGSTFVVTLPPLTVAPEPEPAPPPAAGPPTLGRARVLIIDDEPQIVTSLARLLGLDGHAVTTATTAADALTHLAARPFDLVLCDLMMPECSGVELYERVAAIAPDAAARFVFLTGGIFSDAVHAQLERCPRPVMAKPADLAALRAHVAAALAAPPP